MEIINSGVFLFLVGLNLWEHQNTFREPNTTPKKSYFKQKRTLKKSKSKVLEKVKAHKNMAPNKSQELKIQPIKKESNDFNMIFQDTDEVELIKSSTAYEMDKKLFENIRKSPLCYQVDYGQLRPIAQVIIDNYQVFENKFLDFKMPDNQCLGYITLIVIVKMFFLSFSKVTVLPKLLVATIQIGAVVLAKKQVIAAIEQPSLALFNKNLMMVSQPFFVGISNYNIDILSLILLILGFYTINAIQELQTSQSSLASVMKKHIKLYFNIFDKTREPGQISLLFRQDKFNSSQFELMCCRGIKAVEVIDSIFSTDGAEDLFEIVHSSMSGFRSFEQTNYVYTENDDMIPLEYIQSYIIDRFAKNENYLLNLSADDVQHTILRPNKKAESFLNQVKISKVKLNEMDDYLIIDLTKNVHSRIGSAKISNSLSGKSVKSKKNRLRRKLAVVEMTICDGQNSLPSNHQLIEQQFIAESIRAANDSNHQVVVQVDRAVPLEQISERYEDESVQTILNQSRSRHSSNLLSQSRESAISDRVVQELIGPKRSMTWMKAIDSVSDAPLMIFEAHSLDAISFNHNNSSSSSEDFRGSPKDRYKISRLNQEIDKDLSLLQAANEKLSKQEVDKMIEAYIQKQKADGSEDDSSIRQETMGEEVSNLGGYPFQQNFDAASCYTIGSQKQNNKNLFICGLTPQQIRELKAAKTNMEQTLKNLQNQLNCNKIFLNMVIHDMRNPANAAEYGMTKSLDIINKTKKLYKQFKAKLKALKEKDAKQKERESLELLELKEFKDFSSYDNSEECNYVDIQRMNSLQIKNDPVKKIVKYHEAYSNSLQIETKERLAKPKIMKKCSKIISTDRKSSNKSDKVQQFLTKPRPTQKQSMRKIQSIISMDGIGKIKGDQDPDAKPGSINLYMSGNFSAFTFCQNEGEGNPNAKKSIKASNSLAQESSQERNVKFLNDKIRIMSLDRSDLSADSESSRKNAALNRGALISGLESVCIERPQSSMKRKFFSPNIKSREIPQPEKVKRANSVDQTVYDSVSDQKETKEMGTQTAEQKTYGCQKCNNLKKSRETSCQSCDLHQQFIETMYQNLMQVHDNIQSAIYSIQMNLNLINDLLDLAKIEQTKFSLTQDYFKMETVVMQAFKNVQFLADQKNIKLILEYDEFHDDMISQRELLNSSHRAFRDQKDLWIDRLIYGDQRRYLQILLNFISNALKFTLKNGTIKVRLNLIEYQKDIMRRNSCDDIEEFSDSQSDDQSLKNSSRGVPRSQTIASIAKKDSIEEDIIQGLSKKNTSMVDQYVKYSLKIQDSGVGISEENIDKLFLNFGKLGEHDHMNSAGTGLGLSICKQLIEQMGGEVKVESKLGEGTTFTIIITTKSRVQKLEDNPSTQQQIQVERKSSNFLSIPSQCQSLPKSKKKSSTALENAQISQKSKNKLRNISQFSSGPNLQNNDGEVSGNSYICLSKSNERPIDEMSNKQSFYTNTEQNNQAQSSKSQNNKPKCLIVNDNPIALMQAKFLIQPYCSTILEAQNGYEAIEIVKKFKPQNTSQKPIDFILMDLDMPIMNGWQACHNIRNYQNDDNTLFRVSTKLNLNSGEVSQGGGKSTETVIGSLLNENLFIFAYSALITKDVEEKAMKTGFNKCIEAPLTKRSIEIDIIEFMDKDKKSQHKIASLSFIDDISSIQSNDKMFNRSFLNQSIINPQRRSSGQQEDRDLMNQGKSKFFDKSKGIQTPTRPIGSMRDIYDGQSSQHKNQESSSESISQEGDFISFSKDKFSNKLSKKGSNESKKFMFSRNGSREDVPLDLQSVDKSQQSSFGDYKISIQKMRV